MNTDTNQSPVWDAERISKMRRAVEEIPADGSAILNAATLLSLLDELECARRERDEARSVGEMVIPPHPPGWKS